MEVPTKPFPIVLDKILVDREISDRELARMTKALKQPGGGLSNPTVSALHRGRLDPGMRSMELIAKALKIRPETFGEYQLEVLRAKLDWRDGKYTRARNALLKVTS